MIFLFKSTRSDFNFHLKDPRPAVTENQKMYFFVRAPVAVTKISGAQKPSAGPIKTIRRHQKSVFDNFTCRLVQQKRFEWKTTSQL